ncbi:MAG: phosphoribosylglycinamide formyltransferase [Flavobacteriales bacterium]|nr:phosphoribosylglycinamide formyltransferase [Flavobacteriales bacterium]|tara:strand:- start:568 stop:1137 length:570 start_codon:yes stop_codon:yes gene_type:complete
MKKIAIFASGSGSNAENIVKYFQQNDKIKVHLVGSNNSEAKVLDRVSRYSIPTTIFNKENLMNGDVLAILEQKQIDFIVLAGFLLKIPKMIINKYLNKIINIHPSLLPLYGGKGMYGNYVHQKVLEEGDNETGITIHFVNEKYDDGAIIFQAKCPLEDNLTIKKIAKKVHDLEMKFYPKIIENILNESN